MTVTQKNLNVAINNTTNRKQRAMNSIGVYGLNEVQLQENI